MQKIPCCRGTSSLIYFSIFQVNLHFTLIRCCNLQILKMKFVYKIHDFALCGKSDLSCSSQWAQKRSFISIGGLELLVRTRLPHDKLCIFYRFSLANLTHTHWPTFSNKVPRWKIAEFLLHTRLTHKRLIIKNARVRR